MAGFYLPFLAGFSIPVSGASRYTEHQRHLGNALTEFTGISADKMALEITLASELGVNVTEELGKI